MAETPDDAWGSRTGRSAGELDLTTDEAIRRVYQTVFTRKMESDEGWQDWHAESTAMLQEARDASVDRLASPEFQDRLWEGNRVSGSGACAVSTQAVREDREWASWLAKAAKSAAL